MNNPNDTYLQELEFARDRVKAEMDCPDDPTKIGSLAKEYVSICKEINEYKTKNNSDAKVTAFSDIMNKKKQRLAK